MSLDHRKTTYRPTRTDNRFRTSYALMSQWMNRKGSAEAYRREPLPQTFAIAMQGNAAFPSRPVRSATDMGEYDPSRFMEEFQQRQNQHISAQQASIDENVPIHLRYNNTAGYDDFHKAFQQYSKQWPTSSFPEFGPARLRHGRAGGSWRHVKEVLQAGGARIVFVDGVIRWTDGVKEDEIPGGHLINPRVGEIKSRYMTPKPQQQQRPSEYALNQKAGVEKNNWMIMR